MTSKLTHRGGRERRQPSRNTSAARPFCPLSVLESGAVDQNGEVGGDVPFPRAASEKPCSSGRVEQTGERSDQPAQRLPAAGVGHPCRDDRAGDPEVAEGSYFPDWLLERRRRAERALISVVATSYLLGVSTRRMEKLVEQLGITGLSKSQVSIMAKDLDAQVEAFDRPLDAGPYTFLAADALTMKVREAGRVVNVACLVATGVNADGHLEILGVEVCSVESHAGWLTFSPTTRRVCEDGRRPKRTVLRHTASGRRRGKLHCHEPTWTSVPRNAALADISQLPWRPDVLTRRRPADMC